MDKRTYDSSEILIWNRMQAFRKQQHSNQNLGKRSSIRPHWQSLKNIHKAPSTWTQCRGSQSSVYQRRNIEARHCRISKMNITAEANVQHQDMFVFIHFISVHLLTYKHFVFLDFQKLQIFARHFRKCVRQWDRTTEAYSDFEQFCCSEIKTKG